MSTDLVSTSHPPTGVAVSTPSLPELMKLAELFKESGMFKDVASVAAAFVRIQAGAEMGVAPFQAMSGIHVIQGKPVVGAALLAGLLDAHPAYSYRVDWTRDDSGAASACSVTIAKSNVEKGTATFSLADAERAGLVGKNPTWRTYPENMLFARAMSNAVRWYAGAVTNGSPVYVDGEIEELEPIDLEDLARKPSSEPLPRLRASKEEEKQVSEARKAKGLTTGELSKILDQHGEGKSAPYADQVPAILAAIEASAMDDLGAVTEPQDDAEVVPDAETLL